MQRVRWTLAEAAAVANIIGGLLHSCGYLVAVYGSCLTGEGRDLDLLCIPWRPSPLPPGMCEPAFCGALNLKPQEPGEIGLMKSWSRLYLDPKGRIIDIQFRKAGVTPEEAFAYSMEASRCVE